MMGDNGPTNAMSGLREAAKNQFAHEMSNALKRFVEEHNGDLPTDLSQLNAYFQQPMSDNILKSYKLLPGLSDSGGIIMEKVAGTGL
jgi:hypothetical protein